MNDYNPHDPDNLPLTGSGSVWSQREYVAAMEAGIGFSCHGHGYSRSGSVYQWFHYRLPHQCVSLLIGLDQTVVKRIEHDFTPTLHWPEQCRKAVAE